MGETQCGECTQSQSRLSELHLVCSQVGREAYKVVLLCGGFSIDWGPTNWGSVHIAAVN